VFRLLELGTAVLAFELGEPAFDVQSRTKGSHSQIIPSSGTVPFTIHLIRHWAVYRFEDLSLCDLLHGVEADG